MSMHPTIRLSCAVLAALSMIPAAAFAQSAFKVSSNAKVGYDTNVFLQDDASLASGQTVASIETEADSILLVASLTFTSSYKKDKSLSAEFSYSPEYFLYGSYHNENHLDHKLAASLSGSEGSVKYDAKLGFTYVDGSDVAPAFNRSPAIGGAPVRNRREQDTTKGNASITKDFTNNFVRGVVIGTIQNFRTEHKSNVSGYINYTDRSEINAGLDFGFKLDKASAAFLGVRFGHQGQANILGVVSNYTNNYTRVLLGLEGKLSPNLKLSATVGPDFRKYGTAIRTGIARSRTEIYGDTALSYTPNKTDTFTAAWKRSLIVSGGGRGAYVYSIVETAYKHRFSSSWQLGFNANVEQGNFQDFVAAPRRDWIYSLGATLTHVLPDKSQLEFSLLKDWSESAITSTPGMAYHRWYGVVSFTHTF